MQRPPRTVILSGMENLQDITMLTGVHRLVAAGCPKIAKLATRRALKGKVGSLRWKE